MSNLNKANKWEDDLSAIALMNDFTSHALILSTGLETAGAANTANGIVDLSKYADNTLFIQSVNGPAGNAGTTGLTVFFQTRPTSAIAWYTFRTESAVVASGLSAFKIVGSGVAGMSGVEHFGDVKIIIENTTDSSGTATVQAWVKSRTP